ncbi:MAG: hypothetical protein JSW28_03350 [Thermoplasmata archaeon]|nr:MAG: hypothetical protein JSW28_03350 [Thermoplasmata archaeon]
MAKAKKKQSKEKEDIYISWMEYSKDIGDRVNDMAKESANEYKELYKIWGEYTQKMTEHMAEFPSGETGTFEEMQNVWAQYSSKLGERFLDMSRQDNGSYNELYDLWTQYSGKMSEHLSEVVSENLKNQKELYELWMDAFGIKDAGEKGPASGIDSFWLEVWERSKEKFPPPTLSDREFEIWSKEWNDLWVNAYSKMVANVMKSPAFAAMDGQTLDANLDAISASDKLVGNYLSSMGMPTKENINEIYSKLHDLDKKISQIVRTINKMNGGKKN